MKSKLLSLSFVFVISILVILSCKKEEEVDTDTQSALDHTKSEQAISGTFSTVNHYGINQEEIKGTITVTVDTIGTVNTNYWPRQLTLDFQDGVICEDGNTRSGKLIIRFSGPWHMPDSMLENTSAIVTFNNYYVNNVQRFGEYVITYEGKPSNGPQYTVEANDAKLVFADGKEISWNSTRTTEWISGYDPANLDDTDDVFETTGTASGVNRAGRSYTVDITQPIVNDKSCTYGVTSGIIEVTPAEKATRKINYGDGACDNEATLSVNGVSVKFSF